MALLENAIPFRWIGGPLEVARRARSKGFTPQIRQALERFHDPASLAILKDSPINCLVLSWAGGLPEDGTQQKSAAGLIEAAHKRNLAVVGWVEGSANHEAAIASARSAGLAAVAIRDFRGRPDYPVIAWGERASMPWDAAGPVLAVSDNVWPGVSMPAGGAIAGPTGKPWLDSNGWYIQLACARVQVPVWVMCDPPENGRVVSGQSYPTAICDSEAAGGRWVISLDVNFQTELAEGKASVLAGFKQIGNAARFFEEHALWKSYRSLGVVGIISDFTGDDFELSGEILNLLARRNMQFRVIWKSGAIAQPFAGLKALVYADRTPPTGDLRRRIVNFVAQGGLLVTGPGWISEGSPTDPDFETQFEVRAFGKGRLAVARQELVDAYQVAADTQLLVSHANDLVKIYNSSSSGCTLFTASPDGRKAVLHALSYAGGRSSAARTVWVRQKYRSARLWQIGAAEPTPLEGSPSEEYFGMEYPIPTSTPGYFALEFEV
jgi:hypothetical protein